MIKRIRCKFSGLPTETVNSAESSVVLAITRHGGHVGFLSGLLPTRSTLLDRAVPQFVSAVFEHLEEFSTTVSPTDYGVLEVDRFDKI